jgi:hypothetical protein
MRALRFIVRDRFSFFDFGWLVPAASLLNDGRPVWALGVCLGGAVISGAVRSFVERQS